MAVTRLWVERYRSLVDFRADLGRVTVIQGENGTGKTNVYRALTLLSRGAGGRLAQTLLEEGGMPSALWAGAAPSRGKRAKPVRMTLGTTIDELSYELSLGLPSVDPRSTIFSLDAEIKDELVWIGPKRSRHSELLHRSGAHTSAKDDGGETARFTAVLDRFEPALAQLGEPARFPELFALRERMRRWRFYHQIPTGGDAPARTARSGVRTPVLADDGRDLAAAIATIDDLGFGPARRAAIDDAFPGSEVIVKADAGVFSLALTQRGLRRPMSARELSDGTLRYLCLIVALLSPRPPELLVLNEPETSLHGSLIAPLARLIGEAASSSQIVVTTHSVELASVLVDTVGAGQIELAIEDGQTKARSL